MTMETRGAREVSVSSVWPKEDVGCCETASTILCWQFRIGQVPEQYTKNAIVNMDNDEIAIKVVYSEMIHLRKMWSRKYVVKS